MRHPLPKRAGMLLIYSLILAIFPMFSTMPASANGLGGYAIVHPGGYVCGVIVATSPDPFGNGGVMTSEYMGCPSGSQIVFQTKPSPTGNVAGWHGRDVLYSNGVFRLASGTTITGGIATDPDGRIWDTGSGATITPAPSSNEGSPGSGPVAETSSTVTAPNQVTSSETSTTTPSEPTPNPLPTQPSVSAGTFSPSIIEVAKQFTVTFDISDRASQVNLGEDSVYCLVASVRIRARLSAGNFSGGSWYCEITVPRVLAAGTYPVTAEIAGLGNRGLGNVDVVTEATSDWVPPSDSTQSLNDYDDTYNRICVSLGWTECGIWTIYNANGLQMNRVVGPYPLSRLIALGCQNSRVNLCGGDPKGFAVLNGLYSKDSGVRAPAVPSGSQTSDSTTTTLPVESGTASTDTSTTTTRSSSQAQVGATSTGTLSQAETQTAVTTPNTITPTNVETSTGQQSTSVAIATPVQEVESDGLEEDPVGTVTVRALSSGRYRLIVDTNLDSEEISIRATKKGSRTIRFQATLDEDGRVIINTGRNLSGYRILLTFNDVSLASTRVN